MRMLDHSALPRAVVRNLLSSGSEFLEKKRQPDSKWNLSKAGQKSSNGCLSYVSYPLQNGSS
jgi:hypothetical protein